MSNLIASARQPIGAFNINAIGGKALWLKADASIYVDNGFNPPTNGQTVQQWNDLSGLENHASQGDATKRPTYNASGLNGLPTVSFNGTTDFLQCLNPANFNINQPTLFVVGRWNSIEGAFCGKADYNQSGNNFRKLQLWAHSSSDIRWYAGTNAMSTAETAATTTNWNIYGVLAQLNNLTVINVNGVDATKTGTIDNTTLNSAAFVVGAGGPSNSNLGADFVQADIAKVILFNRILTDWQKRGVIDYLANKWGITVTNIAPASLPTRTIVGGRTIVS